ncbi:MAG TPA: hypothetical protein VK439_03150 [Rubrivivax sp.]|nr:hypothetical protein [Rubrivivax sp.]
MPLAEVTASAPQAVAAITNDSQSRFFCIEWSPSDGDERQKWRSL